MFKLPMAPMLNAVTEATFTPQAFFVDIIFNMAIDAFKTHIFKLWRKMTLFARGDGM